MASFSAQKAFDYRAIDFSQFEGPNVDSKLQETETTGLPFDVFTETVSSASGDTRITIAGDLTDLTSGVFGNAFVFAQQSTDALGNWSYDFRVTDSFINASTVYFMVHAPNAAYSQALFQMLFFGNDTIDLSPFDDAFDAGFGNDIVFGRDGSDLLYGGDGNDTLEGGFGRDVLNGGRGADLVFGDWGADRLSGGRGADHLFGGTGGDTFVYESRGEGHDHIRDFKSNDTIAFKASAFGGLAVGALDSSMFVVRSADNNAQDADDHFIYNATSKALWFDSNGNADGGLFLIAKVDGFDTLTVDDIVLF